MKVIKIIFGVLVVFLVVVVIVVYFGLKNLDGIVKLVV